MANNFNDLPYKFQWRQLVGTGKKGMEAAGWTLIREPGRGLSNVWTAARDGEKSLVSIRTTRDRWFAFPPLDKGHWKTLDDVDEVLVAALDDPENPKQIEVYLFPADVVRFHFNAAYNARLEAGHKIKHNFGMWINLDKDERGIAASAGSGLADKYTPIATYPLNEEIISEEEDLGDPEETPDGMTISEVLVSARSAIARLAGVPEDKVKLDLRIEASA